VEARVPPNTQGITTIVAACRTVLYFSNQIRRASVSLQKQTSPVQVRGQSVHLNRYMRLGLLFGDYFIAGVWEAQTERSPRLRS
jgi:hypothetical protein